MNAAHAPQTLAVDSVSYQKHEKPGRPPVLRVTYHCGLERIDEWLLLEHPGLACAVAVRWWMRRDATGLTPRTVDDALTAVDRLTVPKQIVVRPAVRLFYVVGYVFDDEKRKAA